MILGIYRFSETPKDATFSKFDRKVNVKVATKYSTEVSQSFINNCVRRMPVKCPEIILKVFDKLADSCKSIFKET